MLQPGDFIRRSMSNVQKTQEEIAGTVRFWSVLTLIFVIAKLTGHFAYSWWIVFLPIWGPVVLILGVIFLFLLIHIMELPTKELSK